MLVVMTTTPDISEAEKLAIRIVESKLAACVQILPPITSVYIWEGNVQKGNEYLLLIKTLAEKYYELERFIVVNHSYDVPEVVAIEASNVSESYSKWLGESLAVI